MSWYIRFGPPKAELNRPMSWYGAKAALSAIIIVMVVLTTIWAIKALEGEWNLYIGMVISIWLIMGYLVHPGGDTSMDETDELKEMMGQESGDSGGVVLILKILLWPSNFICGVIYEGILRLKNNF